MSKVNGKNLVFALMFAIAPMSVFDMCSAQDNPELEGVSGLDQAPGIRLRERDFTRGDRKLDRADTGSFRVRLGAFQPSFSNLPEYDQLYEKTSVAPYLGGDHYLWKTGGFAAGYSLKASFFSVNGRPCLTREASDSSACVEKDEEGRTELTLIPAQLSAIAAWHPLASNMLSFEGWFGVEQAYFQEVRILDEDNPENDLVNSAWKTSFVSGLSASVSIGQFDQKATRSLGAGLDLTGMYFTLFVENVLQISSGIPLDRGRVGAGFTFVGR